MYKEGQEDLYYEHKKTLFLMFSVNDECYKKDSSFYDIDSLKIFRNIVANFAQRGYLDRKVRSNLYRIITYGRNIEDEFKDERIVVLNHILDFVNLAPDNSIDFYIAELYYRRKNKKELRKMDYEDLRREIPSIRESIRNDFSVLTSHSNRVSDDEFVENYLKDCINNPMYIESLNTILIECPSMFEDKIFRDRAKSVLELKLCNNDSKAYKKALKRYRIKEK